MEKSELEVDKTNSSKQHYGPDEKDDLCQQDYKKFCKIHAFRLSAAVSVFIVIAYLLGRLAISWPTLVILCVLAIWQWQLKFLEIENFAFREAEIHEHRKKAFENAETVEWLNFFLNRW